MPTRPTHPATPSPASAERGGRRSATPPQESPASVALAPQGDNLTVLAPAPWIPTRQEIDLVKEVIGAPAQLNDQELALFLRECDRRRVHPLDRMILPQKIQGKLTFITTVDYLRSRAADSGEYAGNAAPDFEALGEDHPTVARVTVLRMQQGVPCAYVGEARWSEYLPESEKRAYMWRKMPFKMLGKCAEAEALRKGFPQELSGLYGQEEMDQALGDDAWTPTGALKDVSPVPHQPARPRTGTVPASAIATHPHRSLAPRDYLPAPPPPPPPPPAREREPGDDDDPFGAIAEPEWPEDQARENPEGEPEPQPDDVYAVVDVGDPVVGPSWTRVEVRLEGNEGERVAKVWNSEKRVNILRNALADETLVRVTFKDPPKLYRGEPDWEIVAVEPYGVD